MSEATIINSYRSYSSAVYRALDLLFIQAALGLAVFMYSAVYSMEYFSLSLIASIAYLFIAESSSLYRPQRMGSLRNLSLYVVTSWGLAITIVLGFLFFSKQGAFFSRVQLGMWFVFAAAFLLGWRGLRWQILQRMLREGQHTKTAAIFGLSEIGVKLAQKVSHNPETGYRLAAVYDDRDRARLSGDYRHLHLGNIESGILAAKSGEFDVVFIGLPIKEESRLLSILYELGDSTVDVHLVPDGFMSSLMAAVRDQVGDINTLSIFGTPLQGLSGVLKRCEDIILSTLFLVLAALPLLLISMAIKLSSRGPVLFRQDRYGLGGKRFKVLKFRTMTVAENEALVNQASRNDDRVTPIGRILRRSSLDELPQLVNVLKGDMSLVGPRPHAVAHNEQYRSQIDYYMMRHKMKPGITGLAQIRGFRGETDTLEKMRLRIDSDLDYIQNWSLWLDFKILVLTIPRLFLDENAY